jgi:phage terminase small subunit
MASFLKQKKRGRPVQDIRRPLPVELHKVLKPVANTRRVYGITPKQEEFARLYAGGNLSQTEAVRRAGYTCKKPKVLGWLLLNEKYFPRVVKRVEEIREALAHRADVTFDSHVTKLAEIRDAALEKGNFTAAVAAEKSRGQAAGLYVSRSEILVGKIDQMSRDEVMNEIRRLQAEFPMLALPSSTNVIDIPDNDIKEVMTTAVRDDAEILDFDDRGEDVAELEESDSDGSGMDEA